MTWVVGAASLLGGYGVMVSDTQVTFEQYLFSYLSTWTQFTLAHFEQR